MHDFLGSFKHPNSDDHYRRYLRVKCVKLEGEKITSQVCRIQVKYNTLFSTKKKVKYNTLNKLLTCQYLYYLTNERCYQMSLRHCLTNQE